MLKFADNLDLPVESVTQTFAFLGKRGGGKTYGAQKLCELMLNAGAQVVALDPIGVWYGLRLAADGKKKGFSIPVFGGEHGDVPLEPQAGSLIAKLIVEEKFSAVLDVSAFRKNERKQFVTDFAEELFHRKKTTRSAVHVFFEESQVFVPQKTFKGEERMLGAFEDLIKLGRNYGIGASLISQRPQAVNKDVLNQTEVLLAFQMTGPQERKVIEGWVADKGFNENLADILPTLKIGEAHLWSPQWLRVSKKIHIRKKITFDASSTPTVGAAIIEPKELSPVDVEKITAAMTDVVKRAEATDPKKLQAKLRQLEAELAKKPVAEIQTKEVEIVKEVLPRSIITSFTDRVAEIRNWLDTIEDKVSGDLRQARGVIEELDAEIVSAIERFPASHSQPKAMTPVANVSRPQSSSLPKPAPIIHKNITEATAENRNLSSLQKRILYGLAEIEQFGEKNPHRKALGFFIGSDLTGGPGSKAVKDLMESGFVLCEPGRVELTTEGRSITPRPAPITSLSELHDRVRANRDGLQLRILNALLDYYPAEVHRKVLGPEIASDLTGGPGSKACKHLITTGLLTSPRPGFLKASDAMFPEGLS